MEVSMSLRLKLRIIFIGGIFILLRVSPVFGQATDVQDFTLTDVIGWPVIVGFIVLVILLVFAAMVLFKRKRKT
jgi:hypothetical protein